MDIIRIALLSTIALTGMSAAASAADWVADAPTALVGSNWTGAYIGVQGSMVGLMTVENFDPGFAPPSSEDSEFEGVGTAVGIFAGYDYQISDMFVLGLSGEVNLGDATVDYSGYDYLDLNWDAGIKARAGMLINPTTLFYATAGYSLADIAIDEDYWGTDFTSTPDVLGGWILGAGVESEVAESLFLRGEATATFYGDLGVTNTPAPLWRITPTVVKATAGLAYKF